MGKLKDYVITIICDNRNKIVLEHNSPKLVDKYLGPYLLMRNYQNNTTIYYQGSYDRVIIDNSWFALFESLDVLCQGTSTFEPSDDIEKFIYLFFKFSRGSRFGFSYNTDNAARLLLNELYKLGTTNFIKWLDLSCGIKLEPWTYEKIDNILSI